jgi:hypothetical protein
MEIIDTNGPEEKAKLTRDIFWVFDENKENSKSFEDTFTGQEEWEPDLPHDDPVFKRTEEYISSANVSFNRTEEDNATANLSFSFNRTEEYIASANVSFNRKEEYISSEYGSEPGNELDQASSSNLTRLNKANSIIMSHSQRNRFKRSHEDLLIAEKCEQNMCDLSKIILLKGCSNNSIDSIKK